MVRLYTTRTLTLIISKRTRIFLAQWPRGRIVVNCMFGQNSVRMAFNQNLAGTVFYQKHAGTAF